MPRASAGSSSATKQKRGAAPLHIPPRGTDQAERKRQLNVDAQRRYRKRKREYLQKLEAQLQQSAGPGIEGGQVATVATQSDGTTNEETEISITTTTASVSSDNLDLTASNATWDASGVFAGYIDPAYLEHGTTPASDAFMSYEATATFNNINRDQSSMTGPALQSTSPRSFSGPLHGRSSASALLGPSGNDSAPESANTTSVAESTLLQNYLTPYSPPSTHVESTPPLHSFADEAYLAVFEISLLKGSKAIAQRLQISLDVIWDVGARSSFSDPANAHLSYDHLPATLQPTAAQRCVPHHPMLDLLPWPKVRTKLLLMFCQPFELRPPAARSETVLLDMINDVDDAAEGMKVWGDDPFEPRNWEVGETVWHRWWWAFDQETVRHSNRWRRNRGAPLLRQGVVGSSSENARVVDLEASAVVHPGD